MSDRFKPRRGRSGALIQGGLDPHRVGEPPRIDPKGPHRAVVIRTRVPDSEGKSVRPWPVECDVVLVRTGALVRHVPVAAQIGYTDARPWIPAPTTAAVVAGQIVNIEAALSSRGTVIGPLTPLDEVNGDVVLVDFIEGDWRFPVIRSAMPHLRTRRVITEGDGWDEAQAGADRGTIGSREAYLRHAGTEARINAAGDVLLDAAGATSDQEAEDPAQGRGEVRVRVKDDRRVTIEVGGVDVLVVWRDGAQIRVDLGAGATERLMLGDSFLPLFNDLVGAFNAHTHPVPALGTSLVPTPTPSPAPPVPALPMTAAQHLSEVSRTRST